MNVKKTSFGHIVWLLLEEQENIEVTKEIEKLVEMGKVAIMVSGSEQPSEVMCKLIKGNTSN